MVQGTALPLVPVATAQRLDANHLNEVKKVVVAAHLENNPYWISIFSGGVGGDPNVAPLDISLLPRRNSAIPAAPATVAAELVPLNIEAPLLHVTTTTVAAPTGAEILTRHVLAHRQSTAHGQSYQFRVQFDNEEIEWLELDDLVDPDYTVNESLQQYLAQHPQVKAKGTYIYLNLSLLSG